MLLAVVQTQRGRRWRTIASEDGRGPHAGYECFTTICGWLEGRESRGLWGRGRIVEAETGVIMAWYGLGELETDPAEMAKGRPVINP